MLLHVRQVTHLKGNQLRHEFSSNVVTDVDLAEELHGEVFEPLRALKAFAVVRVSEEAGASEWPNGADSVPEFLYEIGKEVKHVPEPATSWAKPN